MPRLGGSLWTLGLMVAGAGFCSSAMAEAVVDTHQILTPERVFSDPDLSGRRAVGARLSPDGCWLTYLKPKASNALVQDLWIAPAGEGEARILVDADRLSHADKALSEAEKGRRERMRVSARGVVDYQWDKTGQSILVPLDGDIYRVEVATSAVTRLTDTPEDEIDARLDPGGSKIAFVRGGRLVVHPLPTGAPESILTPEASETVTYATAEFIAQEELGRHSGFWWSPRGDTIAYQRTDESGVDQLTRLEVGAEGLKSVSQRYPRAGRPNARVSLFVQALSQDGAARGQAVAVDLGSNPDIYLARVVWSNDGKILYVERLSRDQQHLELLAVDPDSGQSRVVLSETSESWIDLNDDFTPLKSGNFVWASARTGNKHLYLYAASGQLIRQITSGDWPVDHLAAVDEAGDRLFFEAAHVSPITHGLYVTGLSHATPLKAVTAAGGWWTTSVADNGKAFIGTWSDPTTPPRTGLYDSAGKLLRWVEANELTPAHPWYGYRDSYSSPEFGTMKASDGQVLQWMMFKPRGFDSAKRYPVIVSIYGGPARALVHRDWVPPTTRLFQEAGFIVFTLDNRGTPGRSEAFGRAIYRHFGGPDIDDQIEGAHWLQSLPYVDAAHIGIMGWSQGGFVTLMALTAKDSPFVAGASGAPPTAWGLYDSAYTERYMSTPEANPQGYADSDVLRRLDRLKPGALLLMQGLSDDNVQVDNSMRVMAALQQKSIPFELMLYPGERHGIRGNAKNLQRYRLYLDFFTRKLKP